MKVVVCALALIVPLFGLLGCGVKGNPIPPAHQPEIGRGRPDLQRPAATASPTPLPGKGS